MVRRVRKFDLSCMQDTAEGKFLAHMYYSTKLLDLFTQNERSGYPHNGAMHSLVLWVTEEDVEAFLQILSEEMVGKRISTMAIQFIIHVHQNVLCGDIITLEHDRIVADMRY